MVMKLQGNEVAFARLALTILEGHFLDVLKCAITAESVVAGSSPEHMIAVAVAVAVAVAMFDIADARTREQLGVPAKAAELRTH